MRKKNSFVKLLALVVAAWALAGMLVLAAPCDALAAAKPKLSSKSGAVVVGATKKIKVSRASGARITYASKSKKIASVSKKGVVKGLKAGKAKVVVTVKKGSSTTKLTYRLTVRKPAMTKASATVEAGKTLALAVKYKPAKAAKAKYAWSTSNAKVATVKGGTVTAVGAGKATITCKVKALKATYTLTCAVTVSEPAPPAPVVPEQPADPAEPATYTVSFDLGDGVPVKPQTVAAGTCVERPEDPVLDDRVFMGWYADAGFEQEFDFAQPPTSDMVLHARWLRTAPQYTPTLSADAQDVVLENGACHLTFTLFTDVEAGDLLLRNAATNEVLGTFVAQPSAGGDAGDEDSDDAGRAQESYLCVLDSFAAQDGEAASFVADVNGALSNEVRVMFYAAFTEQELDQMDAVDDRLSEALSAEGFYELPDEERQQLAMAALQELAGQGDEEAAGDGDAAGDGAAGDDSPAEEQLIIPESICQSDDGMSFTFMYADGVLGSLSVAKPSPYVNGASESAVEVIDGPTSAPETSIAPDTVGKALILNAFAVLDAGDEERVAPYREIKPQWEARGLRTTVDETVTLEDLRNLDSYDIVEIATHGEVHQWSDNPLLPCLIDVHHNASFELGVWGSRAYNKKYAAELKSNQLVKATKDGKRRYAVMPRFFERNYAEGELDGTIVLFESCCSAGKDGTWDTSLSDALISRGAGAVLTYHNYVAADYSRSMAFACVSGLLDGQTIRSAYDNAVARYGADDSAYDKGGYATAVSKLVGFDDARLIHEGVQNGTFERWYLFSSSIPRWRCVGDARMAWGYRNIRPEGDYNVRFAVVGTGAESSGAVAYGDSSQQGSCISQTLVVPQNATTLEFDYAVASVEPSRTGGSQNDACYVAIETEGDGGRSIESFAQVDDMTWTGKTWLNFFSLDPQNTMLTTDWQHASIDMSGYRSRRVTLRFAVCDNGDKAGVTVCAIDNVLVRKSESSIDVPVV